MAAFRLKLTSIEPMRIPGMTRSGCFGGRAGPIASVRHVCRCLPFLDAGRVAAAACVALLPALTPRSAAAQELMQYPAERGGSGDVWVVLLIPVVFAFLIAAPLAYYRWWLPRRELERAQAYRSSMNELTARYWQARNELAQRHVEDPDERARWERDVQRWYRSTAAQLRREFGIDACHRFERALSASGTEAAEAGESKTAHLRHRLLRASRELQSLIFEFQGGHMA